MVLFCSSFVTADYSNGRAHVERPARTLISLSKPDPPKDIASQQNKGRLLNLSALTTI